MTGLLMSDPPVVKADPVEMARTELDAANQQLNDFKANNPQPEPPIGEDRIWFAAKGDYTFHGRAVDIRDDIVTLRASEGGRTVDLPIARLDEKHHEEIAELFADYQQASSNWQKKCQMLEEEVERQKKTLEKVSLEEAERERQRIAEENAKQRQSLIASQFSSWDGSHTNLTRVIKSQMHDDDSYEHVRTTYSDEGSHLIVTTSYRGKNALGVKILCRATAIVDLNGYVLEFSSE